MKKTCFPILIILLLLNMVSYVEGESTEAWSYKQNLPKTKASINELMSTPLKTSYTIDYYNYINLNDPNIYIIENIDGTVRFEDRSTQPPIIRDGTPEYPKQKGKIITDESGQKLIETVSTVEGNLLTNGEIYLYEKFSVINGIRSDNPYYQYIKGGEKNYYRQYSNKKRRLINQWEGGDYAQHFIPPQFHPIWHANNLSKVYTWEPEENTTISQIDNGFLAEKRGVKGSSLTTADITESGDVMMNSVSMRKSDKAHDNILYSGQNKFHGIVFPTGKITESVNEKGFLKSRVVVHGITISEITPSEFEASINDAIEAK